MKVSGLIILITCSSCSLLTSRDFLAEMEEESYLFQPGRDFELVHGDQGNLGKTLSDYQANAPKSRRQQYQYDQEISLSQALKEKEASLEDENLEQYKNHHHLFKNDSEKLYYLELTTNEEKQAYLREKNATESRVPASHFFSEERASYLEPMPLKLGMSKSEVEQSWGQPQQVEIAGHPRYENERWVYYANGAARYIYFESGRVGGWQAQ